MSRFMVITRLPLSLAFSSAFSFVALLQARKHLQELEERLQVKTIPLSAARFSPIKNQKTDA